MTLDVSFITLGVANVAAATEFYKAMGMTPHDRSNEHITFFDLGGRIFALFGRAALAEDASQVDEHAGKFDGSTLACNVRTTDEVQAMLDRAIAAGGTLLRAPSEPSWGGLRGYFADIDGHPWEVAWNPGCTIDDAGRISF